MTLHITLTPEAEAKLRERAAASGEEVSEYAARVLDRALGRPSLEEKLAPIRRAFAESGMTDDELSELLEQEKHAMRAEKATRLPGGSGPIA
jgi:hypothetical protein